MTGDYNHDEAHIEASRAPLLDHLIELRSRLIVCVIAIVIAFAITVYLIALAGAEGSGDADIDTPPRAAGTDERASRDSVTEGAGESADDSPPLDRDRDAHPSATPGGDDG